MREPTIRYTVAAAAFFALWLQPDWLIRADWWAYDILCRAFSARTGPGQVTVVAVDDATLAKWGRWPWPRDVMGLLVEKTLAAGAAAAVLDIQFPDADRGTRGLPERTSTLTNDEALGAAMRRGQVIAGYSFDFSQNTPDMRCALRPLALARMTGQEQDEPSLFLAPRAVCPVPEVADAAAGLGFLNAYPDPDGLLRRVPILLAHGDRVYPHLALATLLAMRGGGTVALEAGGLRSAIVRAAGRAMPVDERGRMLVRFRRGASPQVSAKDVMEGKALLAGRVALIGGTAAGLRGSLHTPAAPMTEAVEVQAAVLENVLGGGFWSRPGGGRLIEAMGIAAGIGLAGVALRRLRPAAGVAAGAAVGAGIWTACTGVLVGFGVFVSPVPGILASWAALGGLAVWHWSRHRNEAEAARRELDEMRRFTLAAMTAMAEAHDGETANHARRLQRYMGLLCRELADHPRFRQFLNPKMVELLIELTPVHDIGKVGVPDSILLKDGPLTAEEFGVIKQHVDHGRQILESAYKQSGLQNARLFLHACDIVTAHHERWDGSGYPLGLQGEQIPIPARLLAVADVYDALVSKRVYKEAMGHERACETIRAARGTHFDPDVVDAFLSRHEEWAAVAAATRGEKAAGRAAGAS
ncbi:MAG TPA: CHASE2 domain-containing protein [Bryobacteraceae bacterium]|nr:CHASE2 domain-containing protein [Bryobacteraceae bacterium]